ATTQQPPLLQTDLAILEYHVVVLVTPEPGADPVKVWAESAIEVRVEPRRAAVGQRGVCREQLMVRQQDRRALERIELVAVPFDLARLQPRGHVLHRIAVIVARVHAEELPDVIGGAQAEIARALQGAGDAGIDPVDHIEIADAARIIFVVAWDGEERWALDSQFLNESIHH